MFKCPTVFFRLCLWLFVTAVHGAYEADRVLSLPGWSGPLPSKMYSGYLSPTPDIRFYYWYVESEKDPAKDPVVAWFNGGPVSNKDCFIGSVCVGCAWLNPHFSFFF